MAGHPCESCGQNFPTKWELTRHTSRKTPCAGKYTCEHCGHGFASLNTKQRHIRQSCRRRQDMTVPAAPAAPGEVQRLRDQVAALTKLVETQRATIDTMSSALAINNINIANNNITVNIFGSENTDHITRANIGRILNAALKLPTLQGGVQRAVHSAALLIFGDEDHPENVTCYLTHEKARQVMVKADAGWEARSYAEVATPMAVESVDLLFAKQPHENAERYGPLLLELRDNEVEYADPAKMRDILAYNQTLRAAVAEAAPKNGAGEPLT